MALATRCPNCRTLFRINAEQLRAHNGMVRCGACRQVFNAMAHLDYLDPGMMKTGAPAPAPGAVPAGGARAPGAPSAAAAAAQAVATAPPRIAPRPAPRPAPAAARDEEEAQEKTVNTIFAVPAGEEGDFEEEAAEDEPVFLRQLPAERMQRLRVAGVAACVVLAVALALQATLLYRAELAARLPALQPALAGLCNVLGCNASWPMRPEFLAVVNSELQAIPGTSALELTAVIRNRADFPMALPALELTLTDTFERTVGRRVFLAGEYTVVSATDSHSEYLGPGADLSLRLLFQPPVPAAAGFVAYPFYP